MRGSIDCRLLALLDVLVRTNAAPLTLTLADGSRRMVTAQEAVKLLEQSPDRCGRFSGGDGRLADLLNALLEV